MHLEMAHTANQTTFQAGKKSNIVLIEIKEN